MTPEEVNNLIDKAIVAKLRSSDLIDSSQVPELVAQILGVHDDTFSDQTVNKEIRAKLFPPAAKAPPAASTASVQAVAKDKS